MKTIYLLVSKRDDEWGYSVIMACDDKAKAEKLLSRYDSEKRSILNMSIIESELYEVK